MNDRPIKRKYSRIERERRFLLSSLPTACDPNEFERLRDLYLADSNLRLRIVEKPDGSVVISKLGQKKAWSEKPDSDRHREMTTIYLLDGEAKQFIGLVGARSSKRRYKIQEQGWTFAIDVYEQPDSAAGIILCEVECDTDEQLEAIVVPVWADREITSEGKWSGARLAGQ